MPIHRRPSWHVPEREVTPEGVFLNRRAALAGLGIAGLGAAAGLSLPGRAEARAAGEPWTPAPMTNPAYADAGRAVTPEQVTSNYNNFYEFGTHKGIADAAQKLQVDPWTLTIDGKCAKAGKIGLEDLLAKMPIEERVYRHRCVEAWSMVVPWIGFPLAELVKWAEPSSDAKYVRFETLVDEKTMPGIRQGWYPWPYVEGVTIEEALNPLPLMVTGVYGKALPKQFGAPLRLHLPWKYGFKSAKSITRISFTDEQPVGFWQALQGSEYGFWANVNPAFSHPRWSQASERVLGTGDEAPTVIFNGYGEEVAGLYAKIDAGKRGLWF